MRTSTLVVGIGLLVGAARATAGDPAPDFKVDQVMPLPADGVVNLELEVGPVVITRIAVENRPEPQELGEKGKARPRPVVTAHNAGKLAYDMFIDVTLQDDAGKEYMDCRRTVGYDPGNVDDTTLCKMDAMAMSDWPKVTALRLVAHARPKR